MRTDWSSGGLDDITVDFRLNVQALGDFADPPPWK
jgi:hypothetical protein